jgi:hypothetical protein
MLWLYMYNNSHEKTADSHGEVINTRKEILSFERGISTSFAYAHVTPLLIAPGSTVLLPLETSRTTTL